MSQGGPNNTAGSGAPPVETLTGNSGGAVGADAAFNIDVLGNTVTGIDVVGTPASNLLTIIADQATTTQRGTTEYATAIETGQLIDSTRTITPASLKDVLFSPFTVNPQGTGAYPTIQSALDAANAEFIATGFSQTVVVRPGDYTENLTLYPNLALFAASGQVDAGFVTITGVHTLPTTGTQLSIYGITFINDTAIFQGSSGSCQVNLFNVITRLTGVGYTFNIDGYSGQINLFDFLQDDGGTNGFMYNPTGNANFFFISGGIGFTQSSAEAVISGANNLVNNLFTAIKWKFVDNAQVTWNMANYALNTFTFEDNSSMIAQNSAWSTGSNPAFVNNSTGVIELSDINIDSSAANVFQGTGTIKIDSVTYADSNGAAGTVTLTYGDFESGTINAQNVYVGARSPSNPYDISIESSVSGLIGQSIQNTSSNAAAGSNLQMIVEAGAADAFTYYGVNSTTDWAMGIDNSSSDSLKIASGTTPSGTNTWTMTTAGERTMPLQPAFLAQSSTTQTNITGDGTVYTVVFDTEVFDQNSDFNTGTYTFTAPVTGKYAFYMTLDVVNVAAGHTAADIYFKTTNRNYAITSLNPANGRDSNNRCIFNGSCFADMNATDTCFVQFVVYNGTKTVDLLGNDTTNNLTFFSGHLVC